MYSVLEFCWSNCAISLWLLLEGTIARTSRGVQHWLVMQRRRTIFSSFFTYGATHHRLPWWFVGRCNLVFVQFVHCTACSCSISNFNLPSTHALHAFTIITIYVRYIYIYIYNIYIYFRIWHRYLRFYPIKLYTCTTYSPKLSVLRQILLQRFAT